MAQKKHIQNPVPEKNREPQKPNNKKFDKGITKLFGKNCPKCNNIMDKLQGRYECLKCGYKEEVLLQP